MTTRPLDDTTKPSRLHRRRKKKWRVQSLTSITMAVMIRSHSQKTSAGIGTPRNQGPQRPRSTVVFLCPSKTQAALCRLDSVMVGCIGQPLKRLAGSLAGSSNLIQPATQRLEPKGGGLSLYQGVTAMANHAQNTPEIQGQIPQKQTQQPEAVNDFLQQIRDLHTERQAVTEAGIPALVRLARIAEGDTGQAATVRRFLLGLYNGYRFPFNLITLRGLDKALFDDCLAVLKLDARATRQEVHQYFDNGGELFEKFAGMMED
jgi:hypothetical protein